MNILAAWVLLFCDEESAFWLLSTLIETILPLGFYIGRSNAMNGFFIEMEVLITMARREISEIKALGEDSTDFVIQFATMPVLKLYVGVLDLKNTISLWDKLLSEGNIAIIRGTVAILHHIRHQLLPDTFPISLAKTLWAENFQIDSIYYHFVSKIDLSEV
jgi:hypothetical protein